MGQAEQLLSQAAPQGFYEIVSENLKNDSVDKTHTWIEGFQYYGDPPFSFPTFYWFLQDDGVDVYTMRITIRHLSDIVPMKFSWDYNEEQLGGGPTFGGFTGTIDLPDAGPVTQTFSISTSNRRSVNVYGDITSTTFVGPV